MDSCLLATTTLLPLVSLENFTAIRFLLQSSRLLKHFCFAFSPLWLIISLSLFICPHLSPYISCIKTLLEFCWIYSTCVYGRVSGAFHVRKHYIKGWKQQSRLLPFISFRSRILFCFSQIRITSSILWYNHQSRALAWWALEVCCISQMIWNQSFLHATRRLRFGCRNTRYSSLTTSTGFSHVRRWWEIKESVFGTQGKGDCIQTVRPCTYSRSSADVTGIEKSMNRLKTGSETSKGKSSSLFFLPPLKINK